ncbi:hypothetical protein VNO80_06004 [Phaseolus coccineus]|uniref:Large ribosomal subunit protein uL30m n=1 Tax=Phaseolus coccineus TaxID=3886 RepID=A0AAN9RIK8_PHACN
MLFPNLMKRVSHVVFMIDSHFGQSSRIAYWNSHFGAKQQPRCVGFDSSFLTSAPLDPSEPSRRQNSSSDSKIKFTLQYAFGDSHFSDAGNFSACLKTWSRAEGMNAFKAYKACVPIAWSPNLYITLVRGMPGTRRLHRRTLEALRLRKCNRTVMRWNTPTVRGMLQQVKRLVVIETEEMFKARKQKEETHRALRPPLVISHKPPSLTDAL